MHLYLKIKPNQRFDRIEKAGNEWVVRIRAPAVNGKANEHLIEFLSEVLEVPKSKIIVKKGLTSRQKCIEIEADSNYVLERLERTARGSAQ
jgi:uncharacterized protein (TIGR00251 family)